MNITLDDGRTELWQWDTGRKIVVDDKSVSEVHFSKYSSTQAITREVINGKAEIPNFLLQDTHAVTVYAYSGSIENGYTVAEKTFNVAKKPKPANYVETEEDKAILAKLKAAIGDLSELQTEAKDNLVSAINEAATGADWMQNDPDGDGYVKNRPGGYMTDPVITDVDTFTITSAEDRGGIYFAVVAVESSAIMLSDYANGEGVIVDFGGQSYNLTWRSTEGYPACGSAVTGEAPDWSAAPFLIMAGFGGDGGLQGYYVYLQNSVTSPIQVKLKMSKQTPVKIQEKYLDLSQIELSEAKLSEDISKKLNTDDFFHQVVCTSTERHDLVFTSENSKLMQTIIYSQDFLYLVCDKLFACPGVNCFTQITFTNEYYNGRSLAWLGDDHKIVQVASPSGFGVDFTPEPCWANDNRTTFNKFLFLGETPDRKYVYRFSIYQKYVDQRYDTSDYTITVENALTFAPVSKAWDARYNVNLGRLFYHDLIELPDVSADDDGKLLGVTGGVWTPVDMPSGGIDMGITGAAVGQIAKITAVDASGTPTAWEPVDMPSGGAITYDIAATAERSVQNNTLQGFKCSVSSKQLRKAIDAGKTPRLVIDIRNTIMYMPMTNYFLVGAEYAYVNFGCVDEYGLVSVVCDGESEMDAGKPIWLASSSFVTPTY